MPPLPSAQTLTARLDALSDSNKATLLLIQRLSKLEFQPGTSQEGGDVRQELSAEIHENLKQLDEEVELLQQEVEDVLKTGQATSSRRDSTRDTEKSRLAVLLTRLTEDLKSSRAQFRKAQLTAKRNAERARLRERELLFADAHSGPSTPSSAHRRKQTNSRQTEEEVIATASSDVTAALRRTQHLMQSELSRSRFAQETLEQSTAALADLGEKYTDLSTLLGKSRTLVTTLLKSQKSDTWYLETTLYILLTTLIWLVFRRWLYGPLTWFIVWPLKLLFRVAFAVVPTAGVAKTASSISTERQTSTSLIIKPSATERPPSRPVDSDQHVPYVRVGGGGRGYMQQDPSPPHHPYSRQVGQMAEQKQTEQTRPQAEEQRGGEEEEGPIVRGDGTVLEKRDRPANPKKKMWEEDVEAAKHERETAAKTDQAAAGGSRRKRDEL
ncbi:hypothetical protein M011DRAFT_412200 [Sporormia fimetaria CBS 119925]|uniref:Sec20 C-terminal domain-containing protein n=1 Tax=Sporormia fimetaria CBS 119925 TaxID=1340428 RepID=A0A6A6V038_9PLEO|nr:hypothetical protein M011DRAFT_412200 [Sporormia fimetaria CBS 119925]